MKQFSEKIKARLKNNYILYFTIFAVEMYVLQKLTFSWGGDDVAGNYEHRNVYLSVVGEIKHVFEQGGTWTSRIIVYLVGRLAAQFFSRTSYEIWFCLNAIIFAVFAYSIANLRESNNKKYMTIFMIFTMMCVPFIYYKSAGWYVTIVVYMWPIATAVVCMRYILQLADGKKKKISSLIIFGLLLTYAVNLECVSIFMTISLFGLILADVFLKKKIKISLIIYEIICILALCFHVFSPGQQSRYEQEIEHWFIDFNMMTTLDKLDLGIGSTFDEFFFQPNVIYSIFAFLLCLVVWIKYKSTIKKIVSAIPFIVAMVFGIFRDFTSQFFPNLIAYINTSGSQGTVTVQSYAIWKTYIPLVIIAGTCICIILSLILAFDDKYAIVSVFIFLGGVASRIAMGFSPTTWASGRRTYLMMYYVFAMIIALIVNELIANMHSRLLNTIIAIVGGLGILSYINAMYIASW